LIELLVTIVILVTVLGAVIPVLSPNNDARRIRNAARQLQSLITQAQALAAREGRPYGIAFRENQVDLDTNGNRLNDGVALEAFIISERKPYAGFSEFSRARLMFRPDLSPFPDGSRFKVQLVAAATHGGPIFQPPYDFQIDPIPPEVIRRGDRIQVGEHLFRVVDPDKDGDGSPENLSDFPQGEYYSYPPNSAAPIALLSVEPIGQLPLLPKIAPGKYVGVDVVATDAKTYKFLRQASNGGVYAQATRPGSNSAPPLQFPRGVGIDMLASGVDFRVPSATADVPKFLQSDFTTLQSLQIAEIKGLNTSDDSDRPWPRFVAPLTVGVLFDPSGGIHSLTVNGEELQENFWVRPSRLYLLVGRIENATRTLQEIGVDPNNPGPDGLADFTSLTTDDDDTVAQRREQLNWLNRDSLWVTVAGRTGRAVVAENNTAVDPRAIIGPSSSMTPPEQLARQLQAARGFARELAGGGGQ
jgi:type II secretory pathway pseudopilin PulG